MKKISIISLTCALVLGIFGGCTKDDVTLYGTLYGVVNDVDTSEPVSGASVVLSPGGKTKTTGTDGHYEFLDLDPGQYTITVQKTGYQTNRKTITVLASDKAEANIPLTKSN